jgi:hypothetical protein
VPHSRTAIFPWGGHASPTLNADTHAEMVWHFVS